MNVPFFDILTAARTVWGEARGESQQGKLAVAWVIRNRWESDAWYGRGTVKEVCMRPWQFSCWNDNDPNRVKTLNVELDDEILQKCLYAVLGAFNGIESDPTNGCTHYFNPLLAEPGWAEGKQEECRIGNHAFFKGID